MTAAADPRQPVSFDGPTTDPHGRMVRNVLVGRVVVGRLLRMTSGGWRVKWNVYAIPHNAFPNAALMGDAIVKSVLEVEDALALDRRRAQENDR